MSYIRLCSSTQNCIVVFLYYLLSVNSFVDMAVIITNSFVVVTQILAAVLINLTSISVAAS